MKQIIKERIEQINNGIVPKGYKRTKAGLMPDEWINGKETVARDVFASVSFKNNTKNLEVLSATQDKGVVPRRLVDIDIKYNEENVTGYKKVDKGDFVISLRSFQGGIEYSEYDGLVSPAYTVLKPIQSIVDGYYKAYFKSTDFITRLNKGTYGIRDGKQIGYNDFGNMVIHFPPYEEQEKIAEILFTQDKVIELCDKEIEQLLLLKKAYLQELFPKKGSNAPELRFKGYSKPWKSAKVGELLKERVEYAPKSIEYPLMAFIANKGITTKGERYDRSSLIKDEENKPYKRTEKGDFIYSSNNLESGSIGINTYGKASISPVYSIFFSTDLADSDFISRCLIRKDFINEMIKLRQGVIYGQWKIHESDFLKIDVLVPDVLEQKKLGEFLKSIDQSIVLSQKKIEQEKQKKKALMQLLLTGIVRVKND